MKALCVGVSVRPGPQYGSLERAWGAMMTEADKVSELHQEVKNSLLNEDLEKVKNWQKDAYHKQIMGGFKETKEAEDGFRKAQKPWAKKMKEVPQTGRAGGSSRVAGNRRAPVVGRLPTREHQHLAEGTVYIQCFPQQAARCLHRLL